MEKPVDPQKNPRYKMGVGKRERVREMHTTLNTLSKDFDFSVIVKEIFPHQWAYKCVWNSWSELYNTKWEALAAAGKEISEYAQEEIKFLNSPTAQFEQ